MSAIINKIKLIIVYHLFTIPLTWNKPINWKQVLRVLHLTYLPFCHELKQVYVHKLGSFLNRSRKHACLSCTGDIKVALSRLEHARSRMIANDSLPIETKEIHPGNLSWTQSTFLSSSDQQLFNMLWCYSSVI